MQYSTMHNKGGGGAWGGGLWDTCSTPQQCKRGGWGGGGCGIHAVLHLQGGGGGAGVELWDRCSTPQQCTMVGGGGMERVLWDMCSTPQHVTRQRTVHAVLLVFSAETVLHVL